MSANLSTYDNRTRAPGKTAPSVAHGGSNAYCVPRNYNLLRGHSRVFRRRENPPRCASSASDPRNGGRTVEVLSTSGRLRVCRSFGPTGGDRVASVRGRGRRWPRHLLHWRLATPEHRSKKNPPVASF